MCTYRKTAVLLLSLNYFAIVADSHLANVKERVCPERCNFQFNCDPYYSGPPVWVIVDDVCKLFKTDCLFATVNCQRQNECKPRLTTTFQQICQAKCMDGCENAPSKPVCAAFPYVTVHGDRNDGMITFRNQCELDKWSCWNSKAYLQVIEGPCF
ncbi:salivary glue protein Sgs-5-like [Anastrepha ludens]|uniref:salivary glue protein Sgs-5-like n=1 Tax=Anastrepha ludens TaxID=28586 RepID=UPI0023B18535|nr:salivary glue protein Sgs-5-like [Anastrepha ludens]